MINQINEWGDQTHLNHRNRFCNIKPFSNKNVGLFSHNQKGGLTFVILFFGEYHFPLNETTLKTPPAHRQGIEPNAYARFWRPAAPMSYDVFLLNNFIDSLNDLNSILKNFK